MKDRFIAGAGAGFIGAIIQQIYGFIVKSLGFTDYAFHDFGQAFIVSSPSSGFLSDLVGILSQLSNGLIVGIVFAYIISLTSSKYYIIKGLIYGTVLWHLFLGIGTMYKVPALGAVKAGSSLVILIGSMIYGIVTAYFLKIIDTKTNLL